MPIRSASVAAPGRDARRGTRGAAPRRRRGSAALLARQPRARRRAARRHVAHRDPGAAVVALHVDDPVTDRPAASASNAPAACSCAVRPRSSVARASQSPSPVADVLEHEGRAVVARRAHQRGARVAAVATAATRRRPEPREQRRGRAARRVVPGALRAGGRAPELRRRRPTRSARTYQRRRSVPLAPSHSKLNATPVGHSCASQTRTAPGPGPREVRGDRVRALDPAPAAPRCWSRAPHRVRSARACVSSRRSRRPCGALRPGSRGRRSRSRGTIDRDGVPPARPHRRLGQQVLPRHDDVRRLGQPRPRRVDPDHPRGARRRHQLHRHRRRLRAQGSRRRSSARRSRAAGATT